MERYCDYGDWCYRNLHAAETAEAIREKKKCAASRNAPVAVVCVARARFNLPFTEPSIEHCVFRLYARYLYSLLETRSVGIHRLAINLCCSFLPAATA